MPTPRTIAGGISSRPVREQRARSMLIASRGSRSGQLSHGPGGIAAAPTHAAEVLPAARAPRARRRRVRGRARSCRRAPPTASSTSAHVARIALERERRHAEEAEVAGEQHVDVGDEHHHVAVGVPVRGQQLDARRELRGVGDEVRDLAGAELGELVELLVERGHERLVGVDRHLAVEEVARLLRPEHRSRSGTPSCRRRGRRARA